MNDKSLLVNLVAKFSSPAAAEFKGSNRGNFWNVLVRPSRFLGYFLIAICFSAVSASPPEDFPRFQVAGHEQEMTTLRELFWLHYPGAGPKATLWDEWLPDASLWPAVTTDYYIYNVRERWRDV